MTARRGISGEEIRREQEESRRRSKPGATERPLPASVSIFVLRGEIDWVMPLMACFVRGFGKAGLVFLVVAHGFSFFFSRRVTIWRGDDGVHVDVSKLWQRRSRDIKIDGARLRYWNAWFCQGIELSGVNASISASWRRGTWFRPPLGVPATSVLPRFRPTARSIWLNLPNISLNAAAIAAVWNVGEYSVLISLLALYSILSSFANCLLGGPKLLVEPSGSN